MSDDFRGKAVFITGASAGIGAGVAVAFAREGARVALAARRLDKLEAVKARVEEAGGEALAVECDVTNRESIDAAVARTVEAFGGIDVAIANAGFGVNGPFERLTTGDYRRQFETNFFGLIDTAYATLPHLKASHGRLGLVASVLGRVAAPTTSAYNASKFAVVGLAESIYYELADAGVSLTLIMPGVVESEFRRVDNSGAFREERIETAPSWLIVPTDRAARDIVRAVRRRKPQAVITGHGKVMVALNRHFPRTLRTLMRLATRGRTEQLANRRSKTGRE
ncbi:MAG: SDR family NAD(P)-dependent oxidoreductase [FCB group bacterium]|jgi:short-subunit dehydrogenase|nr:SDR family NAD(P)-dependent oxidoreductase [FCB group bacterium]